MELKNKKYIKNTGSLPGFVNGLPNGLSSADYQQALGEWTNRLDDKPIANIGPVDTTAWNNWKNDYFNQKYLQVPNTGLTTLPSIGGNIKSVKSASGVNWSGAGDVASTGVNFLGASINAFANDKSEQDLSAQYGQRQGNKGGIGYVAPNYADINKEMADVRKKNLTNTLGAAGGGAAFGAAVGSIIPGLGTVAGGLIGAGLGAIIGGAGSAKRARERREMVNRFNDKALHLGTDAEGAALTKYLQLSNAEENGVPDKQLLYGHKDGKISSADGPINEEATARVSSGEIIANKYNGTMYRVPGKKNNKDTKLAAVKDSDTIITNKYGLSDYVAATGDIEGAEEMMNLMNKQKLFRASKGKLPHFEEGWIPNAISSGATMLGGLVQYLDAKNQSVKKPNSYVSNPYELEALSTLAGLRINPYPIMQQLRSAEHRTNSAIDRSGGLGVGQRKLSRLSALNTTQNNISNVLSTIQQQNNSYLSDYAKTALQAGANNAKMKMAADQYDLDYYSKAHAARQQGMQAGMYNMINGLQQYYANDFKRRQFNDTMGLYREQLSLDQQRLLHDLYGNGSSFAKDMENYTRNQKNQYLINKVATNPAFNPTKALTYRNLTGKYLSGNKYLKIDPNGIRIR